MAVVGIATQPWQILATANKFLAVISGFGVFLAPATGIMLADYHIVRRRRLKLNDLYVGNDTSIYWFNDGFNWRAPMAFIAGMWPLIPGLIGTVNGYTSPSFTHWIRLYNLTFLVGLAIGCFIFWLLNYLFPVPGIGQDTPFLDETVSTTSDAPSAPEHQIKGRQGSVVKAISTSRSKGEP
ncbi:purine-cytosine permease family protein [Hirsutella rhossiliensis]|uniref:Permease for cytosine/purines, uracil, thiamine, allantoin n=1 Tax=Hirsutella rhossiliensis TaxID=111463 RepID=A0A9P8SM45_9HYPO|nr:permease for cytosine/purines, uracil, thiamine, allantoin [Hirsutella rhossiliensis]KAH0966455.1 permease for cytosine/purines, uracil, thiamine, allantoin [Hirsutella rhossiliensis]